MEALGRKDEAQAFRWQCFERALNSAHLRAYLKRLPDFDDVEAKIRRSMWWPNTRTFMRRCRFLVEWPAHERAAQLVLSRNKEIDGDRYELLDPAARVIEGKYPLAAVLLRRALIEVTLRKGRATRYKHAARHVREIDSLNSQIRDYKNFETHDQFMERLKDASAEDRILAAATQLKLAREDRLWGVLTYFARIEDFAFRPKAVVLAKVSIPKAARSCATS